ncbi:MAG: imidazoleglycerol-phosphate dehydratase HisB [Patescibacteria group bacterium]
MEKIAFIDRDGALIYEPEETKQIDSLAKLKILEGVIPGLKSLLKQGYKLIMVSNQDGIGTASFPMKDFEIPQNELLKILKKNKIEFYKILVCPHLPKDNCTCRKPKIGLVASINYDKKTSIMIGDRESDKKFAKNLGVNFIKAETNSRFPRFAMETRKTKETQISLALNLDGIGNYNIDTGVGFLNHMLELFSKHSLIDLNIKASGDLNVDEHHTTEDIGIVLGRALKKALGDKKGIRRYGFLLPMDESLAQVALDVGGRSYLKLDYKPKREFVGDLPTELLEDFWQAFADNLSCNLNIKVIGRNEHHKIEAMFKAVAKSIKMAVENDSRMKNMLPSTKGKL